MLFNIVGHKIDGTYESWKYMGQKTARDRLASGGGGGVYPTPWGKTVVWCCSNNALIFFIFHISLKTTVNTLIEDISLQDDFMGSLLARTYHIQIALLPYRGRHAPGYPNDTCLVRKSNPYRPHDKRTC